MMLDPNPPQFPTSWANAWGEDSYGLWQAFEVQGVRQVMRWILPGRFQMGSSTAEAGRVDGEKQHPVVISKGFWLAETACTQALWQAVTGQNPSHFDDDPLCPVDAVSWRDCEAFVQQLSHSLPGDLVLRLPTEAEWEYACRADTTTVFNVGDHLLASDANFDGNYPYGNTPKGVFHQRTLPVHEFAPNRWGLFQMHGNLWEWCNDWLGDYPGELAVDPVGPAEGRERVLRGGGWLRAAQSLRAAQRRANSPDARYHFFGLRLAGG